MSEQNNYPKTTILVGHIEGISYILLLFVAMPMKYMLDIPTAVKIMGAVHGFLFTAYLYFLIESWAKLKWKKKTILILVLISLVPFCSVLQKKVIDWGEK